MASIRVKKFIKGLIPEPILSFYRVVKMNNYRLNMLEDEIKNLWLIDRGSVPSNQSEIFRMNEFKVFSQTGEDGIINYIFGKIGTKNKKLIEIGIEDGTECNSANLIKNFGWQGALIEGDSSYAKKAQNYYSNKPVKVIQSFIDRENVNSVIEGSKVTGEIDLLSIDIDGNDYWVWEAIQTVKPRVVIIEYNSFFGNLPLTVKYRPDFRRFKAHHSGKCYGASLPALVKLAEKKGYVLVGCNSLGFNAFFVRKDVARGKFKALRPEEADMSLTNKSENNNNRRLLESMSLEKIK